MDNSIDQQFVEFVVKSLVSKPDAVSIERRIDEKGVLLELTVDPEDLGRVIGKRGATAQSLRTLLRALGTKNDARYNLKIMDNGVYPHQPSSQAVVADDSITPSAPSDTPIDTPVDTPVQADDASQDVSEPEASVPTVEPPAPEAQVGVDEAEANRSDDMVSKTRKELEDLDDLDV
jgi:predicted RNA-binding protein YlqC (UPF0109 family)